MLKNNQSKPAFMVVSGTIREPDKIGPYADAAGPLVEAAGMEVLVRSTPIVLEGSCSNKGFFAVETFPSMDKLMNFWYSDEYQSAKKLREGIVDIDFIVALEGID